MKLSFKPYFIERIQSGRKTVTRRHRHPRFEVGEIVRAVSTEGRLRKVIAECDIRIVSIEKESYPAAGRNSEEEAWAEGFTNWEHFSDVFRLIAGKDALSEPCYRIEFEPVKREAMQP